MRHNLILLLAIMLLAKVAPGQTPTTAVEKLEKLRLELIDVQGKEESLRARVQQLEEDIKPDNIARSLAGVGSTKPEELRESRRRQLELEKKSLLQQLENLIAKRASLESEIAKTEIQAYHESARPSPSAVYQSFMANLGLTRTLLIGLAGGVLAVMGGAFFLVRRLRKTR